MGPAVLLAHSRASRLARPPVGSLAPCHTVRLHGVSFPADIKTLLSKSMNVKIGKRSSSLRSECQHQDTAPSPTRPCRCTGVTRLWVTFPKCFRKLAVLLSWSCSGHLALIFNFMAFFFAGVRCRSVGVWLLNDSGCKTDLWKGSKHFSP